MYYHPYSLLAHGSLNAHTSEVCRKGALIKTDSGGVACIHPWPELGDATLQEELDALRSGNPLPLGRRALDCAKIDGQHRQDGTNLFTDLIVPKSHATLPACVSPATVRRMAQHGFTMGKMKASAHIHCTIERLSLLACMVPDWKWRLDFNSSIDVTEALRFWKQLPNELKELIDFIEDPCPYTHTSWLRLTEAGMPLALDLGSNESSQPKMRTDLNVTRVVKPAREKTPNDETHTMIFTSVMDHPIGQLWAAYEAAIYYKEKGIDHPPLCGLATHLLFESNPFIEELGTCSPTLNLPQGTGLGFDHLLEKINWLDINDL